MEPKRGKKPLLFLSVDAEKAFDRLDWEYMLATLRHAGIGSRMYNWIEALYTRPTAQVRVNGTLSGTFTLY